MDSHHKKDMQNKRQSAGIISKILFLWMVPLFWKGRNKKIDIDDIENVPESSKADLLSDQLQTRWDKECGKALDSEKPKRPSLLRAFLKTFGLRYMGYVSIFLVDGWVIRAAQPTFLRLFIKSFNADDDFNSTSWQCFYASGVIFTSLCHTLFNHPPAFQMCVSGMRCRVAVSSLIYKKALRLSKASEGKSSIGQIVNLLSNDVSRFDYNLHFIAFLFVGPVQLIIFFYLLWCEIGIAAVVGVGFVLVLSPSQYVMGKLSAIYRVEIGKQTDERSKLMSEIIVAMQLIKMYAWEKPFASLIQQLRRLEVKALKKRSFLRAVFMGVFTSNFTFVPFLAIITYGLLGNDVTPDKAFFAVAIFNVMTEVMMYFTPNAAASIGELLSSIKRIEEFLLMEEQEVSKNLKINEKLQGTQIASIKMEHVSGRWDDTKITLEDITFDVSGDKLLMIVGPVGCSKTSLFQTLLAELPIESGRCELNGKVSYSSQEAWLFPGTVRQNILLGKDYSLDRYDAVLSVCALEDDLKQFPHGDSTIVGERGVSLSGGQKARINLARALYQNADIYLLDDPLSAVDTQVSRHIFENCIQTHLKGKLRVLVTHQLQYLPQADHVIVLTDGKILAQGHYDDLMKQGVDFVNLLATEEKEDEKDKATKKALKEKEALLDNEASLEDEEMEKNPEGNVQNLNKEVTAEGSVKAKTYWDYFKSGDSMCQISLLISAFLTNQLIVMCNDYWLSIWTNSERKSVLRREEQLANFTDVTFNDSSILTPFSNNYEYDASVENSGYILGDRNIIMIIYAALAFTVLLLGTTRAIFFFSYTMRISSNIHNRMFNSLVRAPMRFFDVNPSGRIMNRFTKDIGNLDEFLGLSMFDTLDIGLRMIAIMLIVLVLNYYLILPAILLLIAYRYIRIFYIRTSRNIKRIETTTRSPLYTHLASSVQGLTTIRSMKAQKTLIYQFDCYQDMHSATWYHFLAGNSWFSTWLELASLIFLAVVAFSFIGFSDWISSGKVGLAVASLLQLMNIFQFGMRQSAEMENFMTSVERTLEYTRLEPEVSKRSKKYSDKSPVKDWPTNGEIRFTNVYISYDGEKTILKNLNLEIKAKEKIGIVGRTGAGKSSIINALFRMTEIQGEIAIDGYDISAIALHKLRKNISIIPQDPVLFSGTIRYNLDPFEMFTDEQLWKVLEEVELKDLITALDYKVNEGGRNFSVGQRQLVCLGRAILRNNKILVMDEATANVDPRTDNLIQQTIRNKFANCTILTIAHRLQSVMDCDKILVLDKGHIKEYDHPHILLKNPNGFLTKMIAETGSATQNCLRQIAEQAYAHKNILVEKM